MFTRSRQVPAEDTPAFGGIAERFRRAGDLDRAIALCRDGLRKFPNQLSARVTLGWALLDKGQYEHARTELEQVLKRAPDNLAAIRGLAELHERADHEMSMDGHEHWHQQDAVPTASPAPMPSIPVAQAAAAPTTITDAIDDPVLDRFHTAVLSTPVVPVPASDVQLAAASPALSFTTDVIQPIEGLVSPADHAMGFASAGELSTFDPGEPAFAMPATVATSPSPLADLDLSSEASALLMSQLEEVEAAEDWSASPRLVEIPVVDAEPSVAPMGAIHALESTEPSAVMDVASLGDVVSLEPVDPMAPIDLGAELGGLDPLAVLGSPVGDLVPLPDLQAVTPSEPFVSAFAGLPLEGAAEPVVDLPVSESATLEEAFSSLHRSASERSPEPPVTVDPAMVSGLTLPEPDASGDEVLELSMTDLEADGIAVDEEAVATVTFAGAQVIPMPAMMRDGTSRMTALETWLRKVQARRLDLLSGSVA